MRRYDIFSGILLIFSIIDFALPAPVPVREKHQACVDLVHIPRDAITMLGRRGEEDLGKFASLAEEYLKTSGKPVESSDAHVSSSSAPPGPDLGSTNVVQAPVPNPVSSDAHAPSSSAPLGPDHGSTNVVQAPAPNPASSTANPNPLMEPSSPAFESEALSDSEDYEWFKPEGHDAIHRLLNTPTSPDHGLDHELSSAPPGPDHGSTGVVQAPEPNPASSTANPNPLVESSSESSEPEPASSSMSDSESKWLFEPESPNEFKSTGWSAQLNPKKRPWTDMDPDPDFDWDHWMAFVNRPSPPKEFGQADGYQADSERVQQPGPDQDFDWDRWTTIVNQPLPPKEFGQANEYLVKHLQQPDPVPSTNWDFDRIYNPEPLSEVHPPSMSAGLSAGPEHKEVTPPSPGAGLPAGPEHEEATPPSPDLGPLKEPENEVVPGPPPTPESTDPELHSDPQPLSAGVQPEDLRAAIYGSEDLQAALYAAKGKGKELQSRRISGPARDVGNALPRRSCRLMEGHLIRRGSEFLSRPSLFYQPS